ncbi:hypothetical protein G6F61_014983 [Rhizopus arrhizus]|nr:hypothetical protein G6F61_014983 [Rhizopus arrhizus]
MPIATMPESKLRENPSPSAIGRKNGPMPMRRPTVNRVSTAAAPTMFQPKFQPPDSCLSKCFSSMSSYGRSCARAYRHRREARKESAIDTGGKGEA